MIDKLSTILFLVGIMILIVTHLYLLRTGKSCTHKQILTMSIWVVLSIILMAVAWILREKRVNEKYYDYAYQDGKLISGKVFASYPDNVPGTGWIL